ncbi:MAG TPA: ATP-dependent DNA helicase RecG, partial [Solirubrobacterales bacterium]|nr:ATP-dependent DNA helicase RecG [Solirubrobacterales bacterium]
SPKATHDPPRAIGSGEPQDRAELREAQLRFRPRPSHLEAPVRSLKGAGPKLSALAAGIGVETLGDLLWHLPHGFRDRSNVLTIAELRLGEEATILVEVRKARVRPTRNRRLRIVEAEVADGSGLTKAIWFNQAWLIERLRPGTRLLLSGKLDRSAFKVSAHEIIGADGVRERGIHTVGLVPVHSVTDGLSADRVREWVWSASGLGRDSIEPLPAEVRAKRGLPDVADALAAAHFPDSAEAAESARRRLAFEELYLHQVALAARRKGREDKRPGVPLETPGELTRGWLASLPFSPTDGQHQAFAEIDENLASGRPMQRLLMGEVGSGKTVVAVYAMLRAVESGHQAVLMAPTETLAEQHAHTLNGLLATTHVPFTLLTGATKASARREALARLETGELALVVGTHALIEPDVHFARLAVCVVDEQHRFGVRQRAALDAKGPELPDGMRAAPHVLHMTATPIPRTLSLTAYGDLDATTLRELPAGRQPVKTWAVGEEKREGAYEFVRERLREGRQAFFVCPLVEGSEKLEAKAASEEAERLAKSEMRDFRVALLHGQMHSRDKAAAMEAFAAGEADVLVATSVIEVGIDVPNATVMVVEGAERYGLSQLHQLRGRVGRGEHESYCILFGDPASDTARRRLDAIAAERDGFKLAEVDLSLRGEGEILGTLQSGLPRFKAAQLPEDGPLLVDARREVIALGKRYESLDDPALGPLLDAARLRFGDERIEGISA